MLFFEQSFLPGEPFIFEAQEPAVLQVGSGNAPESLQIAVNVVLDDSLQGVVRRVARQTHDVGISRVFLEIEGECVEHRGRQFRVLQAVGAFRERCLVEPGAQERDLREVVEVPCLKGCVLPVVGEAEELAGLFLEVSVPLKLNQGPYCEDGRRRAAVVYAQCPQLGALGPLGLRIGDAARGLEAEQEIAVDQCALEPASL